VPPNTASSDSLPNCDRNPTPNLFVLQSLIDSKILKPRFKRESQKLGDKNAIDVVRGCQVPIFLFIVSDVEYLLLYKAPGIKVQSFLHELVFFFSIEMNGLKMCLNWCHITKRNFRLLYAPCCHLSFKGKRGMIMA